MPSKKQIKSPQQIWENVSSMLVHFVEGIFFYLGVIVARHPWRTITLAWLFVFLSGIGLLRFQIEKNPMKLWVPPDSDYYYDTNWYIDKFSTGLRYQKVLIKAEDVLQPQIMMILNNITNEVNSIELEYKNKSYTLQDLCFKVPDINIFHPTRSKRSIVSHENNETISDIFDTASWIGDTLYCDFFEKLSMVCLQNNILDLWDNDQNSIKNITKHDIVSKLNEIKINPVTGHPVDYSKILGGVEKDDHGVIVSAKSILITWYTEVNMSDINLNEVGNILGTEDWVSPQLAMWEKKFLDLMNLISHDAQHVRLFYESGRSFGDVSGEAMFNELDKLTFGIILMFLYIQFALSRCNWLEIKLTLGSVGLLCVGMAYATAISWCSIIGIPFGPVHSSLPFLLMGLGVDDMFVMNACWKNLSPVESKKSLPIKVGLMLKHAGVSIVITSFTDIVALLIGAITILPSLKSFCIYAAAGVLFIFCFSVTFYVAVFTLDVRRIESKRNGIIFCYKHKSDIKISSEKSIFQKILAEFYRRIVFSFSGKTIVILATLIMTGFSIQSILKLEQRFDPQWFIPDGTYYKEFLDTQEYYYPSEGHTAMVFLGEMNYNTEFPNLYHMVQSLKNEHYVDDITSWVEIFHEYLLKKYDYNLVSSDTISDDQFHKYLSKFLFSESGGRFVMNLKFSAPLICGNPAPNITASSISFKFVKFHGPEEYIPAMNDAKNLVKTLNITSGDGFRSVWSKVFANWVTDEIIGVEVERNIELALICVMACTIVLITNLQMCFWIFICVLLTLVNVLGWMQRWGMTVDIVCCIGLELAIGLCVDYAAHVGHTFLTTTDGSRSERALKTVTTIGSAVLLGGGSTFLSLSLLSMSKAYTFQSFFKIFLLVIIFGLFNGLIFLPVVLSLIGPGAYRAIGSKEVSAEAVELNGKHEVIEKQLGDS